jgi:hypothetical protein
MAALALAMLPTSGAIDACYRIFRSDFPYGLVICRTCETAVLPVHLRGYLNRQHRDLRPALRSEIVAYI